MSDPFAHLIDNEFDGPVAGPAKPMPSVAQAKAGAEFAETCPKCRGTGRFTSWSGRVLGDCFACKGAGKHTFKTSPEARAGGRARTVAKGQQIEANAKAWIEANPAEAKWLADTGRRNIERAGTFTFPQDVLNKLWQYGELTDGQLAAVRRLMEKDANRAAQKIAVAPLVDTAGIDRLKEAFDKAAAFTAAKGRGLTVRSPKITIGGMTISPAKANSANPGALYVKSSDVYLGKITGGRFVASRDCLPDQQKQILAFVADPAQAAKVYGQETGVCCVCNATLRSEWRLRGIGPICAEKMGW